ncbi:hypothetical protein JD844_025629, partial [Phrynosoma platyrhinos]
PDTFRIFNIEFPQRNNILEKIPDRYPPVKPKPRYTLEWRNNPHPIHAKFIKTNPKFLNEPVLYMETEDTKTKQKRGAFVWTEIKPRMVPEGTEPRSCAPQGSRLLEQPKTEKGSPVGNGVTSACLRLPESQETPSDSDTHLSKTDIGTGAKANPKTTEKGQESSGISQANKRDVSCPPGERPSSPAKASSERPQSLLPPVCPPLQSAGENQTA